MTNKLSHLAALQANSKRFSILVAAVALNLCLAYKAHASCRPGTTQQCRIQTAHQPGWLKTAYTILSVDYVPPGTGSYVEYGVGGQVGTTVSTTDSWQSSLEVERGADVSFQGVSLLSETVNFGNAWGGTTTTSIDQQASYAATTRINGPGADDINHDFDQIFLALDPIVNADSWTECTNAVQECIDTFPPRWGPCECLGDMVPRLRWSVDDSRTLPQIVRVGWLTGSLPMPDDVRATLEAHGITTADYPQILAADPFAYDSTGLTPPDPARFFPVAAYPYESVSDTFTYRTNNNYSSSSTAGSSTSHTVKVTASGGPSLLRLRVSDSFTWKHDSQQRVTSGTSDAETFFLTMPSLDYSGTTVMYLYIDKIYKTFMVSPIGPF